MFLRCGGFRLLFARVTPAFHRMPPGRNRSLWGGMVMQTAAEILTVLLIFAMGALLLAL